MTIRLLHQLRQLRPFSSSRSRQGERPLQLTSKITILRPTLFSVVSTASAFGISAYFYQRRMEKENGKDPRDVLEKLKNWISQRRATERSPPPDGFIERTKLMVKRSWHQLSPGQQVVAGLIGAQSVIFFAFNVPALGRFMAKNFLHHPLQSPSYTMLTSSFSHATGFHLLANMYALWSFGPIVFHSLPSASSEHFAAFLISAASASSLASHVFSSSALLLGSSFGKIVNGRYMPGVRTILPSLGFSGIAYALVGYTATKYPDLRVGLLFIPGDLALQDLLPILLGVEAFVLLFTKWQMFDHAAHIGGALFGYAYGQFLERKAWAEANNFAQKAIMK